MDELRNFVELETRAHQVLKFSKNNLNLLIFADLISANQNNSINFLITFRVCLCLNFYVKV